MRQTLSSLLLSLFLLTALGCGDDEAVSSDPSVVATGDGSVKGTLKSGSRSFLGIPYAAPPVGSLRWKDPQPPASWSSAPLDATTAGDICPQIDLGLTKVKGTQSEDCLTVNVHTPLPAPKGAPVMVWVHGGGFVMGAGSEETFDGHTLASEMGVVLVTFNYRLGALGFLAHPSLGKSSGNYGLKDQQAALKWVQKNIAGFGGDPNNVTLFGQSAGSISVCTHLVSPQSAGLFHRAILQSGPCSTSSLTLSSAEAQGKKVATQLKCGTASDPAACLRGKKGDVVNKAMALKTALILGDGASWGPIIDGAVLPGMPMKRIQAGTFNKVPVLGGITRDEGTIFLVSGSMLVMTSAEFDTLVTQVFGAANAAKVKAKYPLSNYKEVSEAAADLIGDAGFICPMRRTLRAVNSAGLKTYAYRYTRVPSFMNVPFLGCYHGAELAFVFHNPTSNGFTAPEKQLSKQMMGYWTRFARTGDPNGGGAPTWPLHAKSSDKHLQLDLTIKEGTALKQAQCDLWDTIDF